MKKYIIILMLTVICQAGYSQKNVEAMFKEFAQAKDVENVNIGKITMKLASIFTDTMGVDGIEVFAFDNCTSETLAKLKKTEKILKEAKYETMVSSNEDGSRVRVMTKIEKDMIRELVVISLGDSNALVRIKGKIKPSDIERVVNKHGDSGN